MAKTKKTPELRFRGFMDEWEERELGDLALETYGGGTPNTSVDEYWDGDIAWIQSSDVEEEQLTNIVPRKFVTKKGIIVSATKLIPGNSIAIVTRVGVGKIAFMPYCYTTSQDFLSLSKLKIDNWYGVYSISKKIKSELHAVQGTSIKGITKEELLAKTIYIPFSKEEQIKIGSLFQNLDALITLHQRKHDKLTTVKKAMLEKMFPKEGTDVPEIRFKGFTGKWERRELGEVAKFRRGSFPQPYGNKEWYDGDGAMPFVQVIDVTETLSLVEDTKQKISIIAQAKSVFVEKGKIVVTLQGSIGRVAIVQYDAYVDRTLLIFEEFKRTVNTLFWAYIIQQKFEIEKKKAPGGTIKTITKEALSVFEILLPVYDEQIKIGSYFQHLDSLISIHKRELDKLKNIKKACLAKMFV
jgi:type I restriction enzyme S subunit